MRPGQILGAVLLLALSPATAEVPRADHGLLGHGCQRCHLKDRRGHPPSGPDDNAISMFLRLSVPPSSDEERDLVAARRIKFIPEPTYGGQLQDFAIQSHSAEGRMVIEYQEVEVELADGDVVSLRKPAYSVADLDYGPMQRETMLSPRVAPQMIGLGLLEAVPAEDILAADSTVTGLVVFFARNLAVPARRNPDDPQVLAGKKLFYEIDCIGCHNSKFRTPPNPELPEQSDQLIWPDTDLLLHDMGEGLADGRPESEASGREWRTPPLWGISLTPTVNGHSFFLLRVLRAPPEIHRRMRNYCGSASADATGSGFAVTSPRGNLVTCWDEAGTYAGSIRLQDVCGVAPGGTPGAFLLSGGAGERMCFRIGTDRGQPLEIAGPRGARWDNHLVKV